MLTVRRPAVLLPSARSKAPLGESYSQWLRSACFSSQPGSWRQVVEPEAWRKWAGDVQRWALGWLRDRGGSSRGVARQRLVSILASQCSYVTGQRLRRAQQIGQLYSNLYSERSHRGLITSLWRRFHSRNRGTGGKLVAAFAAAFMWDNERIQDEELQRCLSDFRNLEAPVVEKARSQERADCEQRRQQQDTGWQLVMERPNFRLWRRPIPGSHLYQYRVFGTYTDVTPRQFFNVQLDTEYRKKWDELVIKLEVIERDDLSGSEIVHWVTHFPYPLYSRDYLYIRRYHVDQKHNLMVLVSRAVEHPDVPESSSYVRVTAYQSQMVIKPHRSFDENGFDYLLTYSDDPQTVFPRYCVSWMVSSGMPDFLEKLHTAAVRARNMEVKVKDYISGRTPESPDSKQLTNTDRQEKNCSSQQMDYA